MPVIDCFFFFSSRRRHTRLTCDWSSDVCSSDLSKRAIPDEVIPLESRKGCLVSAGNPQGPVAKNPFGVRHMPENFFHRPFSRRVPEVSIPLAPPREHLQHLQ